MNADSALVADTYCAMPSASTTFLKRPIVNIAELDAIATQSTGSCWFIANSGIVTL